VGCRYGGPTYSKIFGQKWIIDIKDFLYIAKKVSTFDEMFVISIYIKAGQSFRQKSQISGNFI
jgi:hypothetical protein